MTPVEALAFFLILLAAITAALAASVIILHLRLIQVEYASHTHEPPADVEADDASTPTSAGSKVESLPMRSAGAAETGEVFQFSAAPTPRPAVTHVGRFE